MTINIDESGQNNLDLGSYRSFMNLDLEVHNIKMRLIAALQRCEWQEALRLLGEMNPRMQHRSEYNAIPILIVDDLAAAGASFEVIQAIGEWNAAAKHCTQLAMMERN